MHNDETISKTLINLPPDQRIFNFRLSRAQRVIENAFGIAASRFRILRRRIVASEPKVKRIMKAAVALHNFLIADKLETTWPFCYCQPTHAANA